MRLLPLPLYPAWDDYFFGMFADTNDADWIRRIEGSTEWFWWTRSS